MNRRPPKSTRTDTLVPYTTLFRSIDLLDQPAGRRGLGEDDALADGGGQYRHRLRDGFRERAAQLASDQGAHDAAIDDEGRPQPRLEQARLVDPGDNLAGGPDLDRKSTSMNSSH